MLRKLRRAKDARWCCRPEGRAEKTPRRRAAADAQGERRPPAAEVAELQRAGPWRRAEGRTGAHAAVAGVSAVLRSRATSV